MRFLDDGRICLSNNAAVRVLRGIALELADKRLDPFLADRGPLRADARFGGGLSTPQRPFDSIDSNAGPCPKPDHHANAAPHDLEISAPYYKRR